VKAAQPAGLLLETHMKYVEKRYTLRIHRRDGTSKLLLGVKGSSRKIGSLIEVALGTNEVLKVRMVEHPRRDEPAEAVELSPVTTLKVCSGNVNVPPVKRRHY
jgi:RNA-binding protein YhbY